MFVDCASQCVVVMLDDRIPEPAGAELVGDEDLRRVVRIDLFRAKVDVPGSRLAREYPMPP